MQGAEAQQDADWLRISRELNTLVHDFSDIPACTLKEQSQSPAAQALLDDLRCEARIVGGDGATGHPDERVTGEVEQHCQRSPIQPVNTEDPDIRIERPQVGNFIVPWTGVSLPDGLTGAILEPQRTIYLDPIFMAYADTDLYRHHIRCSASDRIESTAHLLGIIAKQPARRVSVGGTDQHVLPGNAKLGLDAAAQVGQEIIADIAYPTDRDHIHRDDDKLCAAVCDDKRFGVQGIVHHCVGVISGDVAAGNSGSQPCICLI